MEGSLIKNQGPKKKKKRKFAHEKTRHKKNDGNSPEKKVLWVRSLGGPGGNKKFKQTSAGMWEPKESGKPKTCFTGEMYGGKEALFLYSWNHPLDAGGDVQRTTGRS